VGRLDHLERSDCTKHDHYTERQANTAYDRGHRGACSFSIKSRWFFMRLQEYLRLYQRLEGESALTRVYEFLNDSEFMLSRVPLDSVRLVDDRVLLMLCRHSHIHCGALGLRHPLEFADTILSGVNTGQIVGEIGCRGAVPRCPEEGFNLHGPAACGF